MNSCNHKHPGWAHHKLIGAMGTAAMGVYDIANSYLTP